MGLRIGGQVEKVKGKELGYEDFVKKYFTQNRPVVLTGLMDDWRACEDWVSGSGKPNFAFIAEHFGNSKVQVADCGTREFSDQKRMEMSVSEFVDHWIDLSSNDASDGRKPLLYLKDWHFVKEYPEYNAYETPLFFHDDWLNMYLDNYRMHNDPDAYDDTNEICSSDYRFVYMGAKGTWTPLHADVFRSYSWSANVCGRKKWYFLSPSQSHFVFDRNMKNSVYNIFEEVSEKQFPDFKKAIWWECTQEQNEIIFVPSGWYHQVHNLEDTISINHNWFNAYNLTWVWDLLLKDYKEAREYIEDIKDICDDFEGLCQRNLAANTGMNFYDFFVFMVRIAFANLVQLYLSSSNNNPEWISTQRAQHLISNSESLRRIVSKMKSIFSGKNCGSVDFRITLKDQAFRELCTYIGRAYDTIHKQREGDFYDVDQALFEDMDVNFLNTSSCCVSSPEDLVLLIDSALEKLCEIVHGQSLLVSHDG